MDKRYKEIMKDKAIGGISEDGYWNTGCGTAVEFMLI